MALMSIKSREPGPEHPGIGGKPSRPWPAILVSDLESTAAVSRAVRRGELCKIGPRLYTSELAIEPDRVVRRHLVEVVAGLVPGAVIVDRSAATPSYVAGGTTLFLAHPGAGRDIDLPGLRLRVRHGAGAILGDQRFGEDRLYLSSPARALVENQLASRARQGVRSRLRAVELEEYLDRLLRQQGRAELERIADAIPGVADVLQLPTEGGRALALVRELLGSHQIRGRSAVLRARQQGRPYDPDRLVLCETLVAALQAAPVPRRHAPCPAEECELPFFEAYFSNFIEGTEFDVAEARSIVATREVPRQRPEDGHDILGTYHLCSDRAEMRRTPTTAAELEALLLARHASLLAGRPDRHPGQLKERANRAGGTRFVDPELVRGTLREGFGIGRVLVDPFARAVYLGWLVSEVHPFDDGNGRLSRLFLNAELVARGEQRLIVPTSYRGEYLAGLRTLSQQAEPRALIGALDFAQEFTSLVPWDNADRAQQTLTECGAFELADAGGGRLRLPVAG